MCWSKNIYIKKIHNPDKKCHVPHNPLCSWIVDQAPEEQKLSGFERILTVTDLKKGGNKES